MLAFAKQLGSVHGVLAHSMGSAASLYAFAHGLAVRLHLGPLADQGDVDIDQPAAADVQRLLPDGLTALVQVQTGKHSGSELEEVLRKEY